MSVWPSIFCTTFRLRDDRRTRVAAVWRVSWNRKSVTFAAARAFIQGRRQPFLLNG
jgi:hypothetical protein